MYSGSVAGRTKTSKRGEFPTTSFRRLMNEVGVCEKADTATHTRIMIAKMDFN